MSSTKKKEKELRNAACSGKIRDVRKLLNDDTVNVNGKDSSGYTALHWACDCHHDKIVKLLLDHGANIEARSERTTPLMMACSEGHLSTIKLLLARGASVNAANTSGDTPLHLAGYFASKKCQQALIAHGANKRIKNKVGKKPLEPIKSLETLIKEAQR
jgi:ankyrin repeat domain-containing protein 17